MVVTPWLRMASTILEGFTKAGLVGSISGMTEVIPSAGQKSAKRGKGGKIDFVSRKIQVRLDLTELGIEVPMGVDRPFCGTGASRCEEDGGRVISPGLGHFE